MTKILIVEDDHTLSSHLSEFLESEGFQATVTDTRKDAIKLIGQQSFDLALVDLMLPDGSGYPICTVLKHQEGIPVIFLTAVDDEASVVTGFDLGAEDYIIKPFRPMELSARIRNALKRSGRNHPQLWLGDVYIDTTKALVKKRGQEIILSALEYRLLLMFAWHKGETLSRERLLEEIWDAAGEYVNDNTLTVYIKRLREKLEDDPSSSCLIRTVRGIGYRAGV